jgi:DUF4097 and DUF4098 domain-containing protein YvlB
MNRSHILIVAVAVLAAGALHPVAQAYVVSKAIGSIEIASGDHAGDLATQNGSIHVGENATIGLARAVNGSISLGDHATAKEIQTVNGSIELQAGVKVAGTVHTVNGALSLASGADVTGALSNVSGSIRVAAAHVGGGVQTHDGDIELGPNAHIEGGIVAHKTSGRMPGPVPRVIVGPGSVVSGTMKFERPVKLFVSDQATIGAVEGATVIKFSGERPPE